MMKEKSSFSHLPKESMKTKKRTQERIKEIIIITAIIVVIGVSALKILRDYRAFEGITTILPQHVAIFKIYPRIGGPTGTPVEFLPSDSIVVEFLQSLMDFEAYHSTPAFILSHDDTWFVEVVTQDRRILHMKCSVNYTPNIVIVHIGTARYQSRKLLQWYQKYSHLWLTSEESPSQQNILD